MQTLLAVLATSAFCSCVVVLVVRRAVRWVRRRVVRLGERAQLVARAYGVGPQAELARLRREVDRSVTGAHRALAAAKAVDAPVGDVPGLLARLDLAARSVDGELRMLESHRDPRRIEAQLEQSRARVGLITSSAAQLVDGLLHAAGHDGADLVLLQTACGIEADALRSLGPRDSLLSEPTPCCTAGRWDHGTEAGPTEAQPRARGSAGRCASRSDDRVEA